MERKTEKCRQDEVEDEVAATIATYFESKLQDVVSSKLANVKLAQKKNILITSKTTQEIKWP